MTIEGRKDCTGHLCCTLIDHNMGPSTSKLLDKC